MYDLTRTETQSPDGMIIIPRNVRADCLDIICERVSQGATLLELSGEARMPRVAQVTRWLATNEQFKLRYIEALQVHILMEAAQVIQIADGKDEISKARPEMDSPQRAKLRIDTRLRVAERLLPHIFGVKTTVVHKDTQEPQQPLTEALKEAEKAGHSLPSAVEVTPEGVKG